MKVNAKLGGCTSVAKSALSKPPLSSDFVLRQHADIFSVPRLNPKAASTSTMVVGADVSHPAPGVGSGEAASFAAITVSADVHFVKYWADVQTNGNRVEMITTSNIKDHFGPMANKWMQRVGGGQAPARILFIRDGVSEYVVP